MSLYKDKIIVLLAMFLIVVGTWKSASWIVDKDLR